MKTQMLYDGRRIDLAIQAKRSWDELSAEIDYWRAKYELERERLMKLWAIYQEDAAHERTSGLRDRPGFLGDVRSGAPPLEIPRRAAPAEPYRLGPYTLYSRWVEIKHGTAQPIFFFAKRLPRHGAPVPMPAGFAVGVSRSGLPMLHRSRPTRRRQGRLHQDASRRAARRRLPRAKPA